MQDSSSPQHKTLNEVINLKQIFENKIDQILMDRLDHEKNDQTQELLKEIYDIKTQLSDWKNHYNDLKSHSDNKNLNQNEIFDELKKKI